AALALFAATEAGVLAAASRALLLPRATPGLRTLAPDLLGGAPRSSHQPGWVSWLGLGAPEVNVQPGVCGDPIRGAAAGRDFKMKLWDVVAVCLVLFHTASAFPLPAGKRPPEAPAEDRSLGRRRAPFALSSDSNMPEDYPDQFDDVMDFIQATIKRLKRSPDKQMAVLPRRERNRQAAAANPENSKGRGRKSQRGKNRGCVLTAIHLNVTDLGLGYETKEELIFRYCSGSCDAAETTYDKILKNLSRNRRLCKERDQGSQEMFAQNGDEDQGSGGGGGRRRGGGGRQPSWEPGGGRSSYRQLDRRERKQPSGFSRMAADVPGWLLPPFQLIRSTVTDHRCGCGCT
ncbi:hypothetical protein H8959_021480, partial [Pygathrix nigripes]